MGQAPIFPFSQGQNDWERPEQGGSAGHFAFLTEFLSVIDAREQRDSLPIDGRVHKSCRDDPLLHSIAAGKERGAQFFLDKGYPCSYNQSVAGSLPHAARIKSYRSRLQNHPPFTTVQHHSPVFPKSTKSAKRHFVRAGGRRRQTPDPSPPPVTCLYFPR